MIRSLAVAAVVLSGCGATSDGVFAPDTATFRNSISAEAADVQSWRLRQVQVVVPSSLSVSTNPDTRFPSEQIVWWEDPPGDRRAQVQAIVTDGARRGAAALRGTRPVDLVIQVQLFHAVTPVARASGSRAWHDVLFTASVRDARTGAVLATEPGISADLRALQGATATAAVEKGQTQKVRISARIASVVRAWLQSSGADLNRRPPPPRRARVVRPAPVVVVPEIAPGAEPAINPEPSPSVVPEVPDTPQPQPSSDDEEGGEDILRDLADVEET